MEIGYPADGLGSVYFRLFFFVSIGAEGIAGSGRPDFPVF